MKMTKATPVVEEHRLPDKFDTVVFEGYKIGEASTETSRSVRWTEIEIYKTTSGKYVIHTTGKSVLYHVHDGRCNTGAEIRANRLDPDYHQPCDRCRPPDIDDLGANAIVDEELDKHDTKVCGADDLYDRLMIKRHDGSTFLSNPARRAIEMSIRHDPELLGHIGGVRRVS